MDAVETPNTLKSATTIDTALLPMALVLGMSSGLVEGVVHMVLQRLNVLEQVWYQIFWISAFFNAVALGLAALVLRFLLAALPNAGWLRFGSIFVVSGAAF